MLNDITRHNLAAESAAWSDEAESGFSANAWAAAHALAENNGWGFGAPRHPDSSPRHPRSLKGGDQLPYGWGGREPGRPTGRLPVRRL